MSMNASQIEVMEKAMQIGTDAEERRKARLVDAVVTSAAKERGGVVRLEDTLSALHDGRVQTLIIRDGLRVTGWKCPGCGYVTSISAEVCPYCGNKFEQVPDVVELAVHDVMRSGGEVEVIHNDGALEEYENIGALLRY